MKLSTTIRGADVSSPETFLLSFKNILATCTQAGFEILDLNFGHYTRKSSPITEPGWEDWWKRLNEVAIESGVRWSQGHAHFVDWEAEDLADWEWHDELVRRSIIGAGIIGVKTLVVHPKTWPDAAWYSRKASLTTNLESLKKYGEWAAPYGVTIAIENMIEKRQGRRFGSGPEELLELIDLLDDPLFAICWDSGHAHMAGINQVEALRLVGPHLKALHICDNNEEQDEHIPPLAGTIQWTPFMKTLKEIGYKGEFTFEVVSRDYEQSYLVFLQNLYELGTHLLSLAV